MQRIPELDGLRAVAVTAVILDHYAPFRTFANGATARYGGAGVDVFFVLSGFLITTILLKSRGEEHPYRIFYARRSLRILPAYALLLLLVYTAGAMLHEQMSKTLLVGQLLFLRSFKGTDILVQQVLRVMQHPSTMPWVFQKVSQGIIPRDYGRLPMTASLGPTWSLSVEEWFYLLWAPVVLLLSRRVIAACALGLCFAGLLLRCLPNVGTSFFTSVDILVTGALLALWMEYRATLKPRIAGRVDTAINWFSALAAISVVLVSLIHRDLLSRTFIEILAFGATAWLVRHRGSSHPVATALRWRPLVYVGTISYMIYLVHLPLYFLVRHGMDGHGSSWTEMQRMWTVALSSIAATLVIAAASWRFYEGPLLAQKEILSRWLTGAAPPFRMEPPEAFALHEPAES